MSGVVQADRIARENVNATVLMYWNRVIFNIPEIGLNCYISGSCNSNINKADFGDIDLIVQVDAPDKKTAKEILIKEFSSNPYILPFTYKGKVKKYNNTGELLSVKVDQSGFSNLTVQIDNIIALTDEEFHFKCKFLDLPAERQGLILGLIKIHNSRIKGDDETEWDLSSSSLRLRDKNRNNLYQTTNWNEVEELLGSFNLSSSSSFDELIKEIRYIDDRSIRRVQGLFKKMVTVKSGEVGTEKGISKQKYIDRVNEL